MADQLKTPEQIAAARAIHVLGGPVAAARILQVKDERYQTVQSWVANRVPSDYCPAVERETALRGDVVRCEELRPDVAWEVLREQIAPVESAKV
jgi:DNA-binding transcriptional regulator YdaS (Cro superfamily)